MLGVRPLSRVSSIGGVELEAVMQALSDDVWSSAASFFGQFSPILYPILGLLVFLTVAGAFIMFFTSRAK